jgi:hypothetical protein
MNDINFSKEDLEDIHTHGLTPETVTEQLDLFQRGVFTPELIAPCTIGKGVRPIGADDEKRLTTAFRQAAQNGRITKFVPASGAATRMFKNLIAAWNNPDKSLLSSDRNVAALIDNISRFACYDALVKAMARDGLNCRGMIETGGHTAVLEYLLTAKGLNYAALPKGLIPFHRYEKASGDGKYIRTAFEEHLAEAAELFADRNRTCRVHFTVPQQHEQTIKNHLKGTEEHILKQYGVRPDVSFSTQHPATDTIAADGDNMPFRDANGRLVFRPGGHGALLENLDDLRGDIIFIKNIDNIARKEVRQETGPALVAMCGLLVDLQRQIFSLLERLTGEDPETAAIEEMASRAAEFLDLPPAGDLKGLSAQAAGERLAARLNRPLRVCGVVKNVGEPGGGPFWIKDSRGNISAQIVESAQVDMTDPGQKEIWQSSSHFNPVIIACGVRDFRGQPFHLKNFADPLAGIITEKSNDGNHLKALEHPGLWNGAMAFWNTVFVELPAKAFNPVKTLFDLLRDGHCADHGS